MTVYFLSFHWCLYSGFGVGSCYWASPFRLAAETLLESFSTSSRIMCVSDFRVQLIRASVMLLQVLIALIPALSIVDINQAHRRAQQKVLSKRLCALIITCVLVHVSISVHNILAVPHSLGQRWSFSSMASRRSSSNRTGFQCPIDGRSGASFASRLLATSETGFARR